MKNMLMLTWIHAMLEKRVHEIALRMRARDQSHCQLLDQGTAFVPSRTLVLKFITGEGSHFGAFRRKLNFVVARSSLLIVETMADYRQFSPSVPSANLSQGTQESNQYRRTSYRKCDRARRSWSDREDVALIDALKELVAQGWKSDNGFRSGYQKKLKHWLKMDFPNTDLENSL
ncbi:hypothetical protein SASPL_131113 [Salvia splendens]|uniref:Uncharacterized protein n=1 Tax=Salvia splendens TaxID=180675 RepID=A0A8X8X9G5_SALSN|nr:hypothetical protein SASPL_131113 [Salvia splendens]